MANLGSFHNPALYSGCLLDLWQLERVGSGIAEIVTGTHLKMVGTINGRNWGIEITMQNPSSDDAICRMGLNLAPPVVCSFFVFRNRLAMTHPDGTVAAIIPGDRRYTYVEVNGEQRFGIWAFPKGASDEAPEPPEWPAHER